MIEAIQVRGVVKSAFARITIMGLLASFAGLAAFAQEAGNTLEGISAQALPGSKVEITLELSGPAPEPLTFTIDQPARIALDLPDTKLALDSRRTDIGIGVLDTVLAAEAGGRARVVLNLDDLVGYQTRVAGNTVVITLDSPASSAAKVTQFDSMPVASSAAASGNRSIEAIDFRRTETGGGRVIISLSDAGIPVDVRQEGGQIVVNFEGTDLPDELLKRYDVLDFATPVSSIDSVRVDGDARLVIAASGDYEELAYQSDRVFTVEIQPVAEALPERAATIYSGDKEYNGERLTLNFQDIDTRAVLQLLADISGRNIVVSDTVDGNVTLRLQNVPWDQAMDIVLATKGLDMRENGNVIIVAPAKEIAAREKADLESRKEIKQLEPLFSEFVQINYAKAADLAELLSENDGDAAILSDRGSVAIDERTNTLLVRDTAGSIAEVRSLVIKLDVPVRQVLIESRIVVVNDDFSRDMGIKWGYTAFKETSDGLAFVSGSGQGTDTMVGSALDNLAGSGSPFPIQLPDLGDRYNVRLPIVNPAGSFALAVLDDDYLVDLELSASQAEGNTEVISSPRVITANQKEAKIVQGVEIPYQEASSSGATTTQFKDAVLSLTVTPQITPDDRIIMDLIVTKDSVGEILVGPLGGEIPSIDTRQVITQVLVENGQTAVLGGIYETETADFQTKVPFLGDIPFVGNLFKSTRKVSNKSELLVFVTPKILKEGTTIY